MSYHVRLSRHAQMRLEERVTLDRDIRHEIRRRLLGALRIGVVPGRDLAVNVRLGDGSTAVCYPSQMGGWIVATILTPEMRVEGEESA